MSTQLTPGFADPVADSQTCFRAVLDAMARPGKIHSVNGVTAPAPLNNAAAAALLTLADNETPVWLDPDAEPARPWIAFHTGAPQSPLGACMFALALSLPDLARLPAGTDEAPETSATIILQVASLETGQRFILNGPGLREPRTVAINGLPRDFAAIWQANRALFPRGVDLILTAGNQLAALPRGITVREA